MTDEVAARDLPPIPGGTSKDLGEMVPAFSVAIKISHPFLFRLLLKISLNTQILCQLNAVTVKGPRDADRYAKAKLLSLK